MLFLDPSKSWFQQYYNLYLSCDIFCVSLVPREYVSAFLKRKTFNQITCKLSLWFYPIDRVPNKLCDMIRLFL